MQKKKEYRNGDDTFHESVDLLVKVGNYSIMEKNHTFVKQNKVYNHEKFCINSPPQRDSGVLWRE